MKYQHTALLLQQILQQIESELQVLQLWSCDIPSNEALASTAPFACDVMALAPWLQFIFLPRMQALLDARLPLPLSCNIYPMAELTWAPFTADKLPLLSHIKALDTLLSEAVPPHSGQQ